MMVKSIKTGIVNSDTGFFISFCYDLKNKMSRIIFKKTIYKYWRNLSFNS
jgi:hypothetical protein